MQHQRIQLAKPRTVRHQKFVDIIFTIQSQYFGSLRSKENEQQLLQKLMPLTASLQSHLDGLKSRISRPENQQKLIARIDELKDNLQALNSNQSADVFQNIADLLQMLGSAFILEDDYSVSELEAIVMKCRSITRACVDSKTAADIQKVSKINNVILNDLGTKIKARSESLLAKRSAEELMAYYDENFDISTTLLAMAQSKVQKVADENLVQSIMTVSKHSILNLYNLLMWLNVYVDQNSEWNVIDSKCSMLVQTRQIFETLNLKVSEMEANIVLDMIESLKGDFTASLASDSVPFLTKLDQLSQSFAKLFPPQAALTASLKLHQLDQNQLKNFSNALDDFYESYKQYKKQVELDNIRKSKTHRDANTLPRGVVDLNSSLFDSYKNSKYYKNHQKRLEELQAIIGTLGAKDPKDLSEEQILELNRAQNELNELLLDDALKIRSDAVTSLRRKIMEAQTSSQFSPDLHSRMTENLRDFEQNEIIIHNLQRDYIDAEEMKRLKTEFGKLDQQGKLTTDSLFRNSQLETLQLPPDSAALKNSVQKVNANAAKLGIQLSSYLQDQNGISQKVKSELESDKQTFEMTLESQRKKKEEEEKQRALEEQRRQEELLKSKANIVSAEDIYTSDKIAPDAEIDKLPDQGAIIDTTRNLHDHARNYESNDNPIIICVKSIITHLVKAQGYLDSRDKQGLLKVAISLVELCNKLSKDCKELSATPGLKKFLRDELVSYSDASSNDAQQLRILVTLHCNEFMQEYAKSVHSSSDSFQNLLIICNRMTFNVNKSLIQAENSSLAATNAKFPFEKRLFMKLAASK